MFFSVCMLVGWPRRQNVLFRVYVSELAQETECSFPCARDDACDTASGGDCFVSGVGSCGKCDDGSVIQ